MIAHGEGKKVVMSVSLWKSIKPAAWNEVRETNSRHPLKCVCQLFETKKQKKRKRHNAPRPWTGEGESFSWKSSTRPVISQSYFGRHSCEWCQRMTRSCRGWYHKMQAQDAVIPLQQCESWVVANDSIRRLHQPLDRMWFSTSTVFCRNSRTFCLSLRGHLSLFPR